MDENNNVVKQYEPVNGEETNVIEYVYDSDNTPIYFTYGGNIYYYEKNLQGDIVGILDATGNTVVQYTYDIWGKVLSTTGTLASTIGQINPLRYRGYYYDTETALYYLQSRYYSPELMRFISQDDPVLSNNQGEPLGSNLYAYCLNNPVMNVDPTGNLAISTALLFKIIGGISGAFGGYYIGSAIAKELKLKSWKKYLCIGSVMALGTAAGILFPKTTFLYTAVRATLWAAGSSFLTIKKNPIARMLYNHGIWSGGKDLSKQDKDKLIKAGKESSILKSNIKKLLKELNYPSRLNQKKISFSFNSGDLFYALNKVDVFVSGTKKNGKYELSIVLEDTYDFFPWQKIKSFGNVANNLGCLMQCSAIIVTYKINIKFNYTLQV